MSKRLLCPQEYVGVAEMRVTPCDRCSSGWDKRLRRCTIYTGAEGFDDVPEAEIPDCPLKDRCQHNLQDGVCVVRRKGLVCESALATVMTPEEAAAHPLAFNAGLL